MTRAKPLEITFVPAEGTPQAEPTACSPGNLRL